MARWLFVVLARGGGKNQPTVDPSARDSVSPALPDLDADCPGTE
jgi:hypothetical protein